MEQLMAELAQMLTQAAQNMAGGPRAGSASALQPIPSTFCARLHEQCTDRRRPRRCWSRRGTQNLAGDRGVVLFAMRKKRRGIFSKVGEHAHRSSSVSLCRMTCVCVQDSCMPMGFD